MFVTVFLSVVLCAAVSILLVAGVAFVQDNRFFSSAPKEARELIVQRTEELFYGARAMGWVLMVLAVLMILGAFGTAVLDGFKSGYGFAGFFAWFLVMFTAYKLYDMIFFDWFILCRFGFFTHYYPEAAPAVKGRKYGFNLKSQLLKLFVIFPAVSAAAAFVCTLFSR